MFGNGQIFVSHTHQDNQRCQPLLAALDAWQTNYWFDLQELDAGQRFSDRIQQALDQRDTLLRVCTEAAERSYWMDRELRAVRGLHVAFPDHPRLVVHLVLSGDAAGISRTAGPGEIVVDATKNPRSAWMQELRRALGVSVARRVSRRTAIAAGAASVIAVGAAAAATKIFLTPSQVAARPYHPSGMARPVALAPGALPVRWHYSLDFSDPAETGGGSSDNRVGLAADDTAVYALSPSSQVVLAMSLRDSTILWLYPDQSLVPNKILNGGHTIATTVGSSSLFILSELDTGGTAIAGGTSTFNLMAVEKSTGKLAWKSPDLRPQGLGGDPRSEFCLTDSSVFFQLDGKLYGYSQDGKALWPPLTMFVLDSSSLIPLNNPAPALGGSLIYIGTLDGRLLAVDAATGAMSWSVQLTTGDFAPVQSSPAAAGGFVYVGASDGYCYAFNASSGSLAWKTRLINLATYNPGYNAGYSAFMGAVTINNGVVYLQASLLGVGDALKDTWLFALDAKTGKQMWKVDPTKLPIPLPPVLTSSIVGTPSVAPWHPAGNLIYTTLGFASSTTDYQTDLATVQAVVALSQQDGSLHSYFWAPLDGENLQDGFFPSAPVPVQGGLAFMTNEPQVYVLNI